MNPDTGILTNLLTSFIGVFSGGFSRIYPDAMALLAILSALEIAAAAVWWAITEDNAIVSFLRKCMQIGFFIFVVTQYQTLIGVVLDGFVNTGLKAGGGGSYALIKDPSGIVRHGYKVVATLMDHIDKYGVDAALHLPDIIMTYFSVLLILLAFFAIAIQVFITYLEFYIVTVLGLILIPFGVFKHTSFLAEKVFGAIIAFGIRLMVLSFILAVANPELQKLNLGPDPQWSTVFAMILAALTIAVLAWHAPAIASGLISGAPSLTAGAVLGMGVAAAGGIAGVGLAASAAAKGAARMGSSATKTAASTLGSVTTAAKMGASDGGGTAGAVKGVAGLAVGSAKSAYTTVTGGIREAYEDGKMRAFRSSDKTEKAAPEQSGGSGNTQGAYSMPSWAQKIQQAKSVLPSEAHPGAGMQVPIRHE